MSDGTASDRVVAPVFPSAGRVDALTGLRAVTALLVFFFHIRTFFSVDAFGPFERFAQQGASGVGAFFVLSGFVLAWARSADGISHAEFITRRLARVGPAYFVAFAVAFALRLVLGEVGVFGGLASLFLVQAWWPAEDVYFSVEPVFWSLSVEFAFYLCFPFLIGRLRGLGQVRHAFLILYCLAGMCIVAAMAGDLAGASFWVVYISPLTRLLEFVIGVSLGLILVERNARGRLLPAWSPLAALAVAVAAYFSAGSLPEVVRPTLVMIVPWILLIGSLAMSGRGLGLDAAVSVRLGEWSYAFYLIHTLVISLVLKAAGVGGFDAADADLAPLMVGVLVVVSLGASVVGAAALHHLVEIPGRRKVLAWSAARRPIPAEPTPIANAEAPPKTESQVA